MPKSRQKWWAGGSARRRANIRSTFATLHRVGYRQFENFGETWGWTDAEFRRVFRSYKLQAVADHGSLDPSTSMRGSTRRRRSASSTAARAAGRPYHHFEYDFAPDPVASAKNGYKFLNRIRF